jgi:hypothetical protein
MDKLFNNVINDWDSKLTGLDINRFVNLIVNVPALPSLFNGTSLPNVNLGNWLPGFNIPSNIYNPISYPSWAGFSAPMNWVSDLTIRLPGVNFKPNLPSINTGCWAACTSYTLTMRSSSWGSEISWTIDDKINNERSYSNHGTFTQSVCLNSGTRKHCRHPTTATPPSPPPPPPVGAHAGAVMAAAGWGVGRDTDDGSDDDGAAAATAAAACVRTCVRVPADTL